MDPNEKERKGKGLGGPRALEGSAYGVDHGVDWIELPSLHSK
jgi:hypothetical protein